MRLVAHGSSFTSVCIRRTLRPNGSPLACTSGGVFHHYIIVLRGAPRRLPTSHLDLSSRVGGGHPLQARSARTHLVGRALSRRVLRRARQPPPVLILGGTQGTYPGRHPSAFRDLLNDDDTFKTPEHMQERLHRWASPRGCGRNRDVLSLKSSRHAGVVCAVV